MKVNTIYQGDTLEVLKTFPTESIDCFITSPPYWALRDYGVPGQLGLEPTFTEYITKLCDIFDEAKRVLKKSGTCWVNLGDTYWGGGRGGDPKDNNVNKKHSSDKQGKSSDFVPNPKWDNTYQSKCLCQIPFRFSIEMCNRRWILRNTLIWHKPNCMPSSVKDRFTVDFEYVFFFVKNKKYWFEKQIEDQTRIKTRPDWLKKRKVKPTNAKTEGMKGTGADLMRRWLENPEKFTQGRNKRCVWKITTKPFKGAHFAVFPEALVETPIKAGCPKGGIVCDPFFGSGTSGVVTQKLGRNFVGIELNPEYIKIAEKRLAKNKCLWNNPGGG